MSIIVDDKNIGHATAYGYAKSKGYTGTEEEFAELMASYGTVAQEAEASAKESEGYATGKQDGEPVGDQSPYYHNNSKWYKEQAAQSAEDAAGSATGAGDSASDANRDALKAEGFAIGEQNGTPVDEQSPYFHNNASYFAGEAGHSADNASGSASNAGRDALKSEGFAIGKQNGTPVDEQSPYFHNNAEYFKNEAAAKEQAILGLTADATVDANVGTPAVQVEVTEEDNHKKMSFAFRNMKGNTGNGISNVELISKTDGVATYRINFTDGDHFDFEVHDGEVTEERLAEALAEYARVDGYYENLTSGNAEQLVSTVDIEDKVPYNFRTSGGSIDIGDREVDTIVGGTVAWNQLMRDVDDTSQANNWSGNNGSVSYSNKSIVFTATSGYSNKNFGQKTSASQSAIVEHKYLYSCYLKISNLLSLTPVIAPKLGGTITLTGFPENVDKLVQGVVNVTVSGDLRFFIYPWGTGGSTTDGTETATVHDAMIIDLTAMFGSTIADYIYSLETNQVGDGVAYFRKLFPKPYYAYDAGSLQSVQTSGHKMVGFNQWDEEWEVGAYSSATGAKAGSSGRIRCKNPIPVLPSTVYYIKSTEVTQIYVYRADGSYIGQIASALRNATFITPNNCYFITFNLGANTGETYNNDICINLHWDGERDGEYEPYSARTYALDDSLTLRGIPKLDASNNLYYDGDTYESDGTVTRKWGEVTLTKNMSYGISIGTDRNRIACSFYETYGKLNGDFVSDKLVAVPNNFGGYGSADWQIFGSTAAPRMWITVPSSIATVDDFKTYLESNPITVAYQLATPTTESADAFQNPQIVDDWGSEEYIDAAVAAETRDVAIPVGHNTVYQPNLRAKLEMSPDSPGDGDGDYLVRQTSGENEYVPLASNPTISGLVSNMNDLLKYDDVCKIIKITDVSTTLGDVATILIAVNTAGDHIFFDMSALGVMMYLCTIFIDTVNNQYKVFDLVSGRYAEGAYDATMLLTMATAQANGLAVQSQIDYLQGEIDELGGKSVLANWDVLGDMILNGTSTDVISPGDIVDINWIKSVLGTTTSGLTVTCTDMDKFINGVGEAEAKDYLFVFDGSNWTYNGEAITLSDFGLSVTGTPTSGEVMNIKTTVDKIPYTFVGYDDITPCDSNVPHNWCLEETYAPSTKVYDNHESLFCIQQGKSIAAGKYYLPMYSYRSSDTFNACFELSASLGSNDSKVQMSRGASGSTARVDSNGTSKSDVYAVTSMKPVLYGTTTSAGDAVAITYLSDTDAASGGYTLLTSLNVDANDPVVVVGSFDKAALGSNTWELSNIRQWCNDDSKDGSATPTHDNDILSAFNRGSGALYGIDPRVKALLQYAEIPWLCGRDAINSPHYVKATGTAPASDAPIYYERGGVPGNRTYTALDPQPSSGDDVSSYYIFENDYVYNKTYVSEDRCFLLSTHEMSFDIAATEGDAVDLYAEYTNNTYTNSAVAARAKYNKSGGTLNSYRWSRSAVATSAFSARYVKSTGSNNYNSAYDARYYAPAFIIGKKRI